MSQPKKQKVNITNQQLLFRLKHLEEIKGIGIITGEPGLGKTTAIRYWTNALNKTMFKVIYIPH